MADRQYPDWKGRYGDGFVTVPTTTAPVPVHNETCPKCGLAIADGSAWRLDPHRPAHDIRRVHTACVGKPDLPSEGGCQ